MQLFDPDNKFSIFMTFEYLPMNKVHTVSSTAMAYPRNKMGNGVAFVVWDDNKPELEARAKQIVTEMANMVKVTGQGVQYGNFGGCRKFLELVTLNPANETPTDADTGDMPPASGMPKGTRAKELFGDNYPRLQRLKKQCDPDMIFNKWYCIQPAAD